MKLIIDEGELNGRSSGPNLTVVLTTKTTITCHLFITIIYSATQNSCILLYMVCIFNPLTAEKQYIGAPKLIFADRRVINRCSINLFLLIGLGNADLSDMRCQGVK